MPMWRVLILASSGAV